jgi:argininosuccinate lyase
MSAKETRQSMSAENFVNIRKIYGGPSPDETRRALAVERQSERRDENWFAEKTEYLSSAKNNLNEIVENYLDTKFKAV